MNCGLVFCFFMDTATTEIYTYLHTLSLHDALPIVGVTLRGSRSRNFRAPSLEQLFSPVSVSNGPIGYDPCDMDTIGQGHNPAVRLQDCQALFAANPGYGDLATFHDPAENTQPALLSRPEESRVGHERVRKSRYRWSP